VPQDSATEPSSNRPARNVTHPVQVHRRHRRKAIRHIEGIAGQIGPTVRWHDAAGHGRAGRRSHELGRRGINARETIWPNPMAIRTLCIWLALTACSSHTRQPMMGPSRSADRFSISGFSRDLAGRPEHDFVHVHIVGLIDGKGDRTREGLGRNGIGLIEALHAARHLRLRDAAR
jgi:hypothetical protein